MDECESSNCITKEMNKQNTSPKKSLDFVGKRNGRAEQCCSKASA